MCSFLGYYFEIWKWCSEKICLFVVNSLWPAIITRTTQTGDRATIQKQHFSRDITETIHKGKLHVCQQGEVFIFPELLEKSLWSKKKKKKTICWWWAMHRAVFMTLLKMWQASQKPTRALFLEGLSDFRSWDQTHYHLGHNRRFLQGDSVRDFALRASLFQRQRWGETDKSSCLPLYPVTLSLLLLGSFTFP